MPVLACCMLLVALMSVCHSPEGAFLTKAGFLLLELRLAAVCAAWVDVPVSMLLEVANPTLHGRVRQLGSMLNCYIKLMWWCLGGVIHKSAHTANIQ